MEKHTGPKATPSNGAFTAINSEPASAKASTVNTEQEQLPRKNILKRCRATLLGASPFEELCSPPVLKPLRGTPKLDADVSGPYFMSEYTSPFAMPGAQDPDVQAEGDDARKKPTRVSQACDMCHDRKTKVGVAVPSFFYLLQGRPLPFWSMVHANEKGSHSATRMPHATHVRV